MGLQLINLSKSKDQLLSSVIRDVLIQTNENLLSGNILYNDWKNAGYIQEAMVKVAAKPNLIELIDGTSISKSFEVTWEITSLQYYHLYEFEKFNNELCTINLLGVQTYLKNVFVNVELDATFNKNGEAKIRLFGTKRVKSLRDLIDGNPWGELPEPWAQAAPDSDAPPGGSGGGSGIQYL